MASVGVTNTGVTQLRADDRRPVEKTISRTCPVCRSAEQGPIFVERSTHLRALDGYAYASRKNPEFMSLRLVNCPSCRVVYAPELPNPDDIKRGYADAEFDTALEAAAAARSYWDALSSALEDLPRGPAIEVGSGTGAFLEHLAAAGFSPVIGVEPSATAIAAATPHAKTMLCLGTFEETEWPLDHFRLFACFQTLEHLIEPFELVASAFRLLRPGARIALVTHDRMAWINRRLGRRSPIIDIEHLQLFCPRSICTLLDRAGFADVKVLPLRNTYPLRYWIRLLPLPRALKNTIIAGLSGVTLDRVRVTLAVGNMVVLARKPGAG
jgi:SAM-dependent methyltransferase